MNDEGYNKMVNTVEKLIALEMAREQPYFDYQERRIKELKKMSELQKQGKEIDPKVIKEIEDKFKRIGLLNEDGTWSDYYVPKE